MPRAETRSAAFAGALLLAAVAAPARADEGFWPLVPPPVAAARAAGHGDIDPALFERLQAASVRIVARSRGEELAGSGCFVGRSGLIVTSGERLIELLEDRRGLPHPLGGRGHLAQEREEERLCPGLSVERIGALEEVSEQLLAAEREVLRLGGGPFLARRTVAATLARLVVEAEREEAARVVAAPGSPPRRVRAVTACGEQRHFLVRYESFDDVRLVFMPAPIEGRYRPDPPLLDVAILRAYRDGIAVGCEEPLRPARSPVARGDFVATLGHPESSLRARSVAELEFLRSTALPLRLDRLEVAQAVLQTLRDATPRYLEPCVVENLQALAQEHRSIEAWWRALDDPESQRSPSRQLEVRRAALRSDPESLAAWEAHESLLAKRFADYAAVAARDFWREVIYDAAAAAMGEAVPPHEWWRDRLYALDSPSLRRSEEWRTGSRSDAIADFMVVGVVERARQRFEPDDPLAVALAGWESAAPVQKRGVRWGALRLDPNAQERRHAELQERLLSLHLELLPATVAAFGASFSDAAPHEEERWRAAFSDAAPPAEANGAARFSFGVVTDTGAAGARARGVAALGGGSTDSFTTDCDALAGSAGGAVVGREGRLLGILSTSTFHRDWFDPDARSTVVDFRGLLTLLRSVDRAESLVAELTAE